MKNLIQKKRKFLCRTIFFLILFLFSAGMPFSLGMPPTEPLDDSYEDNDTLETAAELTPGNYSLMLLDLDWFRINCSVNDYLSIIIKIKNSDERIETSLHDANEHTLVYGRHYANYETLDWHYTEKSVAYFSVQSWDVPASGIQYNLSIRLYHDIDAETDDEWELNDQLYYAPTMDVGNYTHLRLVSASDTDCYKIYVPEDRMLKVSLHHELGSHNIGIHLFDSEEDFIQTVHYRTSVNDHSISYFAREVSEIYLRIDSNLKSSQFINYSLSVEFFDPRLPVQLQYHAAIGDKFTYNLDTSFELYAKNAFYSAMTDYMKSESEDNTGSVTIDEDFNYKSYVQDLTAFATRTIPIQLTISDLYSLEKAGYLETYEYEQLGYQDIVEGEIQIQDGSSWVTPAEYVLSQCDELEDILLDHVGNQYFMEEYESEIDNCVSELNKFDENDFAKLPLQTQFVVNEAFWTFLENQNVTLRDGTPFPQTPLPNYIPPYLANRMVFNDPSNPFTGILPNLCYPQGFSFAEYFAWYEQVTAFMKTYGQENDLVGDLGNLFDMTLEDFLGSVGITKINLKDKSFGLVWTYDELNFAEIDTLIQNISPYPNEESFEVRVQDYLLDCSLDPETFQGTAGISCEYDEDMILTSFVFYFDGMGQFNFSEGSPTAKNPNVEGKQVSLSGHISLVREGYYAPSLQQIELGELGNLRDMTQAPRTPILESVPGYSSLILGLLGVISSIAIGFRIKSYQKR